MIYIKRLPKPAILVQKEAEWTENFLNSEKKRPDNSKYAHPEIKQQLHTMSFNKCFYCERILKGVPKEIDHYIEVADEKGRELAYNWENLYLACDNCNNKVPHKNIAVTAALNPCKNTNEEIAQHLTFEDEIITTVNHSEIGLNTIQKFRLNSGIFE
jgi:hypothetical protein